MSAFFEFVGAVFCIVGGGMLALGLLAMIGDWAIRRANYVGPFLRFYGAELKRKKNDLPA